ncbi:MAG: PLP-dependent aminotransferase family protein [Clostridiales Family XIII bacterium]|jgi:GntR family transcriptional regulator/MocR family aminotransferase|nr:PLP-dependent aminotransferase family protein [Clostridiales Family XIII bacterium]
MIVLDARGALPLYVRIYNQIKSDILGGEIAPGAKLPSGRALSSELCVSRNTVDLAYSRLADEGFIAGVPRVGYFAETPDAFLAPAKEFDEAEGAKERRGAESIKSAKEFHGAGSAKSTEGTKGTKGVEDADYGDVKFDFRGDRLLPDELPRTRWQKLIMRSFWENDTANLSRRERFDDDAGLRDEIRKYVYRFRNIECETFQIFPAADELACLELVCLLFKSRNIGPRIGMENPCSDRHRRTFSRNGFDVCPVALDAKGASLGPVEAADVGAVHLSPSCHFPTGAVMARSRRDEFADWARSNDTYIIENDDGYHYYYGQRPLPAIHSLCPENVVYIAGLSDVLFPGGTASWMILPTDMASELRARLEDREPLVPFLTRRPLELYMRDGRLESHLRRMRRRQGLKREALIGALTETFGSRISVSDTKAGTHILVRIKSTVGEDELVEQARRAGVALCPTSRYRHNGADAGDGSNEVDAADAGDRNRKVDGAALLLRCGGIRLEDIPRAVRSLGEAWAEPSPRP